MFRILIIQSLSNNLNNITGNVLYLEELAQCLEEQEHFDNVYVFNSYVDADRQTLLQDRYTKIIKDTNEIQDGDVIIVDFAGLKQLFLLHPNFLNKIKLCFIMNSATTHKAIPDIVTNNFKAIMDNRDKFYLLLQQAFKTGTEDYFLFRNKVIHYTRGFYFNNYIKESLDNEIDCWYVHTPINGGVEQKENIIDVVNRYCRIHEFVYTTEANTYNPAHKYFGLMYIRSKDYMPRLPYEFWYYKKPVVFFDVSTGLLKNYRIDELPLYLPVLKSNLPTCNLRAFTNFLRQHGYNDRRLTKRV